MNEEGAIVQNVSGLPNLAFFSRGWYYLGHEIGNSGFVKQQAEHVFA